MDTGMSPATTAESPSLAVDQPTSRRRGGGQKRKASNLNSGNTSTPPTTSSSKRQAREKPSPVFFPPIHNGPCTRARQQPNNALSFYESAAYWDAVVKSDAVAPPEFGGGGVVKVEEEKEDWEALEANLEAEYDVIKSRDVNSHVVPIHSGWFSWTKVHPLEERALPTFFNGKSEKRTPEIYMEIRNSIMNRFHSDPNTQIEVKDLSELSVGELDARQEVMEFLDYWGLINYHPFPETDTTSLTVDADEVENTDSLIQKLYHFEAEQTCSLAAPRNNMATPTVPSRLLPESVIAEELLRAEGPDVEYHCNSCAADCSRKRYHCQKQADFDLCTECFNDRKFNSGMSPSDFILMEPAEAAGASGGKWTDQETLLLLEALELFSENWNEIAEHVATKTKAQCILHFVQMPIEDTFLDCDDEVDASVKENADAAATNNDTSPPKDVPETIETKDGVDASIKENADAAATNNDNQPLSSPMEISTPVDPSKPKIDQEIGENCAVKALREAFEAVGSLPSPEEKLSFADAGNPVMALAAFLGRLVEPNVVTSSTRSSLKSISSNGSSLQLAARHSFLLEYPKDDKKKSTDAKRAVVETVEPEGEKDMNEKEKQKEEKSSVSIVSNDSLNDQDNRSGKDLITEEKELLVSSDKDETLVTEELGLSNSPEKDKNMDTEENGSSGSPEKDKDPVTEVKGHLASSNGECTEQPVGATGTDLMVTDEKVEPSLPNESNSLELQKEQTPSVAEEKEEPTQTPSVAEEKDEPTSQVELPSSSGKESGDGAPLVVESQATEAPKDEEMISDSLPSEKGDPHQPNTSISLVGNGENSVKAKAKDCKSENKDPLDTKNDTGMYNTKRAAVTAISAAAVKAKLLADEEEDQIRQLATSLIEKQLHKLETKLAFFSEMDNVVARVREQLERSKQRLYHERAQIIAARLGISASSSRPAAPQGPQSLPNRIATTFPNAIARPPMSMTPQRPSISRPMMPPVPPSLNPVVPSTVAGNTIEHLN